MKSIVKFFTGLPVSVAVSIIFLTIVYVTGMIVVPSVMVSITIICGVFASVFTITSWFIDRRYK